MRERRRLRMMQRLTAVHKVKRSAAEDSLAMARHREADARSEEDEAGRELELALAQWLGHVTSPGFSPEFGRDLADRLIDRDSSAAMAAARAQAAADLHARRQREWQGLEAQVRAGEKSSQRLERDLSRRDEERRLAGLADIATYRKCRP